MAGNEETQPLLSPPRVSDAENDSPPGNWREIHVKDSIYAFMLFIPPMESYRNGYYCSWAVALAYILMAVNVLLQVSLTVIAGNHILDHHARFLDTLITSETGQQKFQMQRRLHGAMNPLTWMEVVYEQFKSPDESLPGCCSGVECALSGLECCASSASQGSAQLLSLSRPRASSPQSSRKPAKKRRGHLDGRSGAHGNTICHVINGTLDCAQPSFFFLNRWSQLDADGDGIWSLSESRADLSNFGCLVGIPLEEVFHHAVLSIMRDHARSATLSKKVVALPPELTTRQGIPKVFFELWRGHVATCVSFDMDKCGQMVANGAYDGLLAPHMLEFWGGVTDLETAVEYCHSMLKPGGLCDIALPGTYLLYQTRVRDKCGEPLVSVGPAHRNPYRPKDAMIIMNVSYQNLETYQMIHARGFLFFLCMILFMWYVNLIDEFRDILKLADLLRNFPIGEINTRSRRLHSHAYLGDTLDQKEKTVIESIDPKHRFMCLVSFLVRFWLLLYMGNAGSAFILSTHSFSDLLLNAVALAFIFELPEFLYRYIVSGRIKQKLDKVTPMRFISSFHCLWLGKYVGKRAFCGFAIAPIMAIGLVIHNDVGNTMPIIEALQCSCLTSGPRCMMANQLTREWWNEHWKRVAEIPHAFVDADRASFTLATPHAATGKSWLQISAEADIFQIT